MFLVVLHLLEDLRSSQETPRSRVLNWHLLGLATVYHHLDPCSFQAFRGHLKHSVGVSLHLHSSVVLRAPFLLGESFSASVRPYLDVLVVVLGPFHWGVMADFLGHLQVPD